MLNKFFSGHIGFHNGVRISASLNTALLIVATLIARKRLPPKVEKKFPIASWLREPPYASLLVGWVPEFPGYVLLIASICRSVFAFLGLFYPFFYLQLDAVVHGVDKKFAFYAVRHIFLVPIFQFLTPCRPPFWMQRVSWVGAPLACLLRIWVYSTLEHSQPFALALSSSAC